MINDVHLRVCIYECIFVCEMFVRACIYASEKERDERQRVMMMTV